MLISGVCHLVVAEVCDRALSAHSPSECDVNALAAGDAGTAAVSRGWQACAVFSDSKAPLEG